MEACVSRTHVWILRVDIDMNSVGLTVWSPLCFFVGWANEFRFAPRCLPYVNVTFHIYNSSVITLVSFKADTGQSLYHKCSKPPEGTTHVALIWAYVVSGKSCRRNERIITLSQKPIVIRRLLQLQGWLCFMVARIWSEFRFILRNGREIELYWCEIWFHLTYFL